VELELTEATTVQQVRLLLDGGADIGFVVPPIREAGNLKVELVTEDRLIAVLPIAHPLSQRKRLKLADLKTEPWILFPARQGPGLHARIMAACERQGSFRISLRKPSRWRRSSIWLRAVGYARAIAYAASSPVLDGFIKAVRGTVGILEAIA
jgi:DNA-binding transcriptional LysR family regulator